jgi:hypothetical protein
MTECQFFKITKDAVQNFDILEYRTSERTSQVGAITGVYEKVISCFMEEKLVARLTIKICNFETILEAKKSDGHFVVIPERKLKGCVKACAKKTVDYLKFRNKTAKLIDDFIDDNDLSKERRYHLLNFFIGRSIVTYSMDDDKRMNNFKDFVNRIIEFFGWETKLKLSDIVYDEPEPKFQMSDGSVSAIEGE